MNDQNLESIADAMSKVSDDELRDELRKYDLNISEEKYEIAFSAFGFSDWMSGICVDILKVGAPPVPETELNAIRWRAVFTLRSYVAFVYMRSEHLENGLDKVLDGSPLRIYRDFFRKGSKNDGGVTIAQHIRNALCHGTFELSNDLKIASFRDKHPSTDKVWSAKISTKTFLDELCPQIRKLYFCAYETKRG